MLQIPRKVTTAIWVLQSSQHIHSTIETCNVAWRLKWMKLKLNPLPFAVRNSVWTENNLSKTKGENSTYFHRSPLSLHMLGILQGSARKCNYGVKFSWWLGIATDAYPWPNILPFDQWKGQCVRFLSSWSIYFDMWFSIF